MNQQFLLTKVVATLGPASESPEMIRSLIEAGVDAFRLNFSHGSMDTHSGMLAKVRKVSRELNLPVAVIGDLSGPKIRIGEVTEGGIQLEQDQVVEFIHGDRKVDPSAQSGRVQFSTNYPNFIAEIQQGHRILLDDGAIALQCLSKEGLGESQSLLCKVLNRGVITSHKGVNLPDTDLSVPALTTKDHLFIDFANENKLDFLALSFVRTANDVALLKAKTKIPVISKIEKPQALDNLEEILRVTDLIMVARGDLGVEIDLAEVAVHQKRIIHLCHEYGVPVIVATQMLQSMIESPSPTRAEVSDVANAIFDGADAVMLSGETAVGNYPVEAVRMLNRIAEKTNDYIRSGPNTTVVPTIIRERMKRSAALAHGVQTIVGDMDIKMIVTWSQMGGSAIYLSQFRVTIPIIAFTNDEQILQRMSLLFGLFPLFMEQPKSGSRFVTQVDELLKKNGWAENGDAIVFVLGEPITRPGVTNRLVIHYIGDTD
jgi:pyruvate kinase